MPTSSITKDFIIHNPATLNKLIDNLDNYKPSAQTKDKNKLSSLEYGKEKLRKLNEAVPNNI